MTKTEATRYAKRLVCGYIEQLFHGKDHPLVYDDFSVDDLEGRRLSPQDDDRVCDAMNKLHGQLDARSCTERESFERTSGLHYKASGRPGAKWKGYDAWMKKQGRR
jgi:hypothetical protein